MNTYFSPSRKGLFNLPVGDDAVCRLSGSRNQDVDTSGH